MRNQTFDDAGNLRYRSELEVDNTDAGNNRLDFFIGYYSADDKLAFADRHEGVAYASADQFAGNRGVQEMYRYDALGRRILTRSRRGSNCSSSVTECQPFIERAVWDGDQLLYEIRTPDSLPESDTQASGAHYAYGRVAYLHGPGIDAPLTVLRLLLAGQPDIVPMAPHANWHGDVFGASLMNGNPQSGCAPSSGCPEITWPANTQTLDGILHTDLEHEAWWGSLLQNQVDGSGLKYQRNRYYDPGTGQFTQQDPIGLSGGANLYAFAGSDPANSSDPFGLFELRILGSELKKQIGALRASDATVDKLFAQLESSKRLYVIANADEVPELEVWERTSGMTYGGRGEERLVGEESAKVGMSGVSGIAFVSTRGSLGHWSGRTTPGRAAAHEAVHLKGIDDRGRKYGHCERAFDHDSEIQSASGLKSYRGSCQVP